MDTKLTVSGIPDGFQSSGNDHQTLLIRLDELILTYFDLLDAYSELQKHISQDMSSVINNPILHFDILYHIIES